MAIDISTAKERHDEKYLDINISVDTITMLYKLYVGIKLGNNSVDSIAPSEYLF